jgi:ABC-2 type transport system ATP-binding protein
MSDPGPVTAPLAYAVRGLRKSHGGASAPATLDIDLDIEAGTVFGLLGPNGAGKTTLVRQLAGLSRPDAGSIRLLGHDVVADPGLTRRLVAYLGQEEPALAELPVRTAVETTGRLRGLGRPDARRDAEALLAELALTAVADRPQVSLSGGQRRLACVAAALVADRPVLVLDEPTTGLDPVARRAVWAAVRRRRAELGSTVLLVTHNVDEAAWLLDRVAVLEAGRVIACDTPARLTAAVDDTVRLRVVWRSSPPPGDGLAAELAAFAVGSVGGGPAERVQVARVPRSTAHELLGRLTAGPLLDRLDDVTVTAPGLEDVYLALGGRSHDLEHG